MTEHSLPRSSLKARLAAAGTVLLMIACCLGAPLIVGALGAVTVGSAIGGAAIFVAPVVVCVLVARRLLPSRRC